MTGAAAAAMSGVGREMHALMAELFPICRSITGPGVRETLRRLSQVAPMEIFEVPSGTRCFDWTVPDEWVVHDAFIAGPDGQRLIDFHVSNLHVVSYSEPVDASMSFDQLRPHLHTRPDLPDAIPYVTSYYKRRWGFCLSQRQLESLGPGPFHVYIDSKLAPGSLTYGEIRIPGDSSEEVLLSTYVCHPSMANNELSGPVVTAFIARALLDRLRLRYSYRIVFAPETIGALCYLSRHLDTLKQRVVAGYVVTCVGGNGSATYLQTRNGHTLTDRLTTHVLRHCGEPFQTRPYTTRGSDERQYDAPGVDLPVGSLMRSKYGEYKEYHTSLDDLTLVTAGQLEASLRLYLMCIEALEQNRSYRIQTIGEPNLGSRGLYPTLGAGAQADLQTETLLGLCAYCDGDHDLVDIAELHERPVWDFYPAVAALTSCGLLRA